MTLFGPIGADGRHLLNIEDLHRLISSAYHSLKPGGKILFELSTKSTYRAMIDQPKSYPLRQLTKAPRHLDLKHPFFSVMVDSNYDAKTEVLKQTRHFHFLDFEHEVAETISLSWENRFFPIGQIVEIAENSGFTRIERADYPAVSNAIDEQEPIITISASR